MMKSEVLYPTGRHYTTMGGKHSRGKLSLDHSQVSTMADTSLQPDEIGTTTRGLLLGGQAKEGLSHAVVYTWCNMVQGRSPLEGTLSLATATSSGNGSPSGV